jgi:hypothetical protein
MALAILAAFVLNGCGTAWTGGRGLGASYRPGNVFSNSRPLPASVRRIAVLPLMPSDSTAALEAGVDALEPILQSELGKSQRFEIVPVSGDQLRQWTGRSVWRTDEALPADFLDRVREGSGSDAVLFSQLTLFQAYKPVAVGWKFSLVECAGDKKAQILWSVDEVMDSGEPGVARGARAYYAQHIRNESLLSDSAMVLLSPRQFGQFSLSGLLSTLPQR